MSDNILDLPCISANYRSAISEAKKVLDPVTGNSITDIIIDAMKNGGNTELGDLKQALKRYFEIYFRYYDQGERRAQSSDSFLMERDFSSRVDLGVDSIMGRFFDGSDNELLDIRNKLQSIDLIKIADGDFFVKEPVRSEFIDKDRPSRMEQENCCIRKIDSGYLEGPVSSLLRDYVDGKLSGCEVNEELNGLVQSFIESGLLTSDGEVTEKCFQKRMGFVGCEKSKI